eukprot:TRINITY_DN6926_c0_g1_i1.p1 TRINITY_DN6926_c0_g1~~TRINITY_DN6926_c0_g1_i1.p1  ORF type:complete len:273 (-),score=30.78 TRINITY_DN6926_c0_g1_i1:35-853(-)
MYCEKDDLTEEETQSSKQSGLPQELRHSKSASSLTSLSEEALYTMFMQIEQKNKALVRELTTLKQRMSAYEKDLGKTQWGLRYSRRMVITANFLVGIWIFWRRLLWYAFKKRKKTTRLTITAVRKPETFVRTYLKEAYVYAIGQSWIFFLASILLMSKEEWRRQLGLIVSSAASIYMAYKNRFMGSNYFNLFANLLYATADWSTSPSWSQSPTLDDFIGTKTTKLTRTQSKIWHDQIEDNANVALNYLNSHFSNELVSSKREDVFVTINENR